MAVLRGTARVGVVDMQPPTGWASLLSPLAHIACWMGGSDIHSRTWSAVEGGCTGVTSATVRGEHIVAMAGTHGVSGVSRLPDPADSR